MCNTTHTHPARERKKHDDKNINKSSPRGGGVFPWKIVKKITKLFYVSFNNVQDIRDGRRGQIKRRSGGVGEMTGNSILGNFSGY